jgi:hypothetical protein
MEPNFSQIFEEAEKHVAVIKDDKLREIAFGKLVSHLLEKDHTPPLNKNIDTERVLLKSRKMNKHKTEGPKAWLIELINEGFFASPRTSPAIREELENRSHHLSATDITSPLQKLCHEKLLRRKKTSSGSGSKTILHWVTW